MISRLVSFALALLLLLCLAFAAVSFRAAFSVVWKGNAVGAARGLFLWGHYAHGYRNFTVLHRRDPGGQIPGNVLLGFHYFVSGKGLRLIGVPLWFPALLLTLALWHFARRALRRPPADGRCLACGYDLRASPERCPECGTAIGPKAEAPA